MPISPKSLSRRRFLGTLAAAPLAASAALHSSAAPTRAADESVAVFSKHLQYLDYTALAETVAEAGYNAIDLTVRPGGHVLPERVEEDLPKAAEAAKKAGIRISMMATAIADTEDPLTERILKTASRLGINYYRMAWLSYDEQKGMIGSLDYFRPRLKALAEMNRQYGMHGAYQNHAGTLIGGPIWDIYYLLRDVDPQWLGVQYDIRHATVEGGNSWPNDFKLIAPLISIQAIKDFKWGQVRGRWEPVTVPLGEGMVDFPAYFKAIREKEIRTPVTLHFEYPFPGEDGQNLSTAARQKEAVRLMNRDLQKYRALRQGAGL